LSLSASWGRKKRERTEKRTISSLDLFESPSRKGKKRKGGDCRRRPPLFFYLGTAQSDGKKKEKKRRGSRIGDGRCLLVLSRTRDSGKNCATPKTFLVWTLPEKKKRGKKEKDVRGTPSVTCGKEREGRKKKKKKGSVF